MTAIRPGDGEPAFPEWDEVTIERLASTLVESAGGDHDRPVILAIDGRGGSGKSTLANRVADLFPRSAIVHSDDIAWAYSIFGWEDLLIEHVLTPLRAGGSVDYRPPGWVTDDRAGSISIPAGLELVIVEGTGTSRAEFAGLLDATIWIQTDFDQAKSRAIDRDVESGVNGDRQQTLAFWDLWQREEIPFFLADRPWERATAVVAGSPVIPLGRNSVALARRPGAASRTQG